jgi:hypothetical protein
MEAFLPYFLRQRRLRSVLLTLVIALLALSARAENPPTREQLDYFEKHVRPVLVDRCYSSAIRRDAAVRCKAGCGWIRRRPCAAAATPGRCSNRASPTTACCSPRCGTRLYEMPPDGKLSAEVVEHFVRWIEMGAPDPRHEKPAAEMPEPVAVDGVGSLGFSAAGACRSAVGSGRPVAADRYRPLRAGSPRAKRPDAVAACRSGGLSFADCTTT